MSIYRRGEHGLWREPALLLGLASGIWLAFCRAVSLRNAAIQDSQLAVRIPGRGAGATDHAPHSRGAILVSSLVHEQIMGNDDHAFPVRSLPWRGW